MKQPSTSQETHLTYVPKEAALPEGSPAKKQAATNNRRTKNQHDLPSAEHPDACSLAILERERERHVRRCWRVVTATCPLSRRFLENFPPTASRFRPIKLKQFLPHLGRQLADSSLLVQFEVIDEVKCCKGVWRTAD